MNALAAHVTRVVRPVLLANLRTSYSSINFLSNGRQHINYERLKKCLYLNIFYLESDSWPLCLPSINRINACASVRYLSKAKDRGKDKKKVGKPKVTLSDEEMSEVVPIYELREELDKLLEKFKSDCAQQLMVRSNTAAIENLEVEFETQKFPLNELAQISKKPNLVVLNLASMPTALKPVLAALHSTAMNLTPQQEGTTIYVPIPKVTREHRETLAKNAKALFTKTKEELNRSFAAFSNYAKKKQKQGVSSELVFNTCENLKVIIDQKVAECEEVYKKKVQDLLGE